VSIGGGGGPYCRSNVGVVSVLGPPQPRLCTSLVTRLVCCG